MNAANLFVAQMINGLDADLQLLWERFLRVDILVRWLEDICDNARPARAWPNIGRSMRLPRLPSARRQELCDAINKLEESLVAGLGNLWTSMRMVEVGLDEMTATFDGTDPLKPAHRERLVNVHTELEQLIDCTESYAMAVERREPSEELIRWVQCTVSAMRYMMG
jgi:hypothetical protein